MALDLVLGIDSCSDWISVALAGGGRLLASESLWAPRRHAELLPLLVEEVLSKSSRSMLDLSAVSVTVGPGSFTGIKIGLAYSRGLGLALGVELLGIGSLEAMAYPWAGARSTAVLAVLPAKPGLYYYGLLPPRSSEFLGPRCGTIQDLVEELMGLGTQADVVGEGIPESSGLTYSSGLAGPRGWFSSTRAVAAAMAPFDELGRALLTVAEPRYVRPPDLTIKDPARKEVS